MRAPRFSESGHVVCGWQEHTETHTGSRAPGSLFSLQQPSQNESRAARRTDGADPWRAADVGVEHLPRGVYLRTEKNGRGARRTGDASEVEGGSGGLAGGAGPRSWLGGGGMDASQARLSLASHHYPLLLLLLCKWRGGGGDIRHWVLASRRHDEGCVPGNEGEGAGVVRHDPGNPVACGGCEL